MSISHGKLQMLFSRIGESEPLEEFLIHTACNESPLLQGHLAK